MFVDIFHTVFLYLLYLFIINSCKTLLVRDKVHAIPACFGKTFKSIPLIDKIIKFDVTPMIKIVSTDSSVVFRILNYLYLFFNLSFLSLKYVIICLMLLICLLKLFTSFNLFPKLCSKSILSIGAARYNLSVFWSNFIA